MASTTPHSAVPVSYLLCYGISMTYRVSYSVVKVRELLPCIRVPVSCSHILSCNVNWSMPLGSTVGVRRYLSSATPSGACRSVHPYRTTLRIPLHKLLFVHDPYDMVGDAKNGGNKPFFPIRVDVVQLETDSKILPCTKIPS